MEDTGTAANTVVEAFGKLSAVDIQKILEAGTKALKIRQRNVIEQVLEAFKTVEANEVGVEIPVDLSSIDIKILTHQWSAAESIVRIMTSNLKDSGIRFSIRIIDDPMQLLIVHILLHSVPTDNGYTGKLSIDEALSLLKE